MVVVVVLVLVEVEVAEVKVKVEEWQGTAEDGIEQFELAQLVAQPREWGVGGVEERISQQLLAGEGQLWATDHAPAPAPSAVASALARPMLAHAWGLISPRP